MMVGCNLPSYKVELKNINSFKFLEKALSAEIKRQSEALDSGEKLTQETRGYDENTKKTFSERSKADSQDYRYFPEADLPPVVSQAPYNLGDLPELPEQKRKRFSDQYKISKDFIDILVLDKKRADYFESAAKLNNNYKTLVDLIVNKKLDEKYPEPAGLVKKLIELTHVEYATEEETKSAVNLAFMDNKKAVEEYKNGKTNVIGFLIGMVQKRLEGKGSPKLVQETLVRELQRQ